jgi:hypothetical protein
MKGKSLSCEKARAVCIVKTMAKGGHPPKKETEKEAWFLSPFRPETQASFKVSKSKNLWFDHGAGFGGNVIDLVMRLYDCRVRDALHFLSDVPPSFSFHPQPFVPPSDDGLVVIGANPIWHFGLEAYLKERNIALETAKKYCKEVHYSCKGRNYFAIGLQNDSGGWELRNKYYKSSSSPKDITYLQIGCRKLIVTEGMFDFLTVVDFYCDNTDFLILNSLSLVKRAMKYIELYGHIELYLDNDEAGKRVTARLMQNHKNCIDKSYLYEEYKDVNEMWAGRKKKN